MRYKWCCTLEPKSKIVLVVESMMDYSCTVNFTQCPLSVSARTDSRLGVRVGTYKTLVMAFISPFGSLTTMSPFPTTGWMCPPVVHTVLCRFKREIDNK